PANELAIRAIGGGVDYDVATRRSSKEECSAIDYHKLVWLELWLHGEPDDAVGLDGKLHDQENQADEEQGLHQFAHQMCATIRRGPGEYRRRCLHLLHDVPLQVLSEREIPSACRAPGCRPRHASPRVATRRHASPWNAMA